MVYHGGRSFTNRSKSVGRRLISGDKVIPSVTCHRGVSFMNKGRVSVSSFPHNIKRPLFRVKQRAPYYLIRITSDFV